jgi:hypothetical protein
MENFLPKKPSSPGPVISLVIAFVFIVFGIGGLFLYMDLAEHRIMPRYKDVQTLAADPELRTWATNLLARTPTYAALTTNMGPDCPKRLLGSRSFPRPRLAKVFGDQNPGYIELRWSSGFYGQAMLVVGPTNYVSPFSSGHKLQDGIYYFRGG